MNIEQSLYWAYEQAGVPVVYGSTWCDTRSSAPVDAFASTHAATTWRMRVEQLEESDREVLKAKYGLQPSGLNYLADVVEREFQVDRRTAEGLVLGWLKHPDRPRVWQLADQLKVSDRTVKRLTRRVYLKLDDMNRNALYLLSYLIETGGVTMYNTNQLN